MIGMEVGFEKIMEKEEPQDNEQHEQFDQNDDPEPFTYRHPTETIIVKEEYFRKQIVAAMFVDRMHIKLGKSLPFYLNTTEQI